MAPQRTISLTAYTAQHIRTININKNAKDFFYSLGKILPNGAEIKATAHTHTQSTHTNHIRIHTQTKLKIKKERKEKSRRRIGLRV